MGIEIKEHIPGQNVETFIQAGREVFKHDPTWVAPLDFEMLDRLSPSKNPLFKRTKDSHDAYMKELLLYTQIAENYYDNYLLSKMRKG